MFRNLFFILRCGIILTLGIAIMVIGIVIWGQSTSQYGMVIESETQAWSQNPIINVTISNTSDCPKNYQPVAGKFFGTQDYCETLLGSRTIGNCGKKKGSKHYGLGEQDVMTFLEGNLICIKKQQNVDYHSLASQRMNECSQQNSCGPSQDPDKKFCVSSDRQCPINSFLMFQFETSLDNNTYTEQQLTPNWYGYQIYDFKAKSPVIDFYASVSKPCGNLQQKYSRRDKSIHDIYTEYGTETCKFEMNGSPVHTLFSQTGYSTTELSAYNNQKGLISSIKSKVFDYNSQDLEQNQFSLYQRSYSLWKQSCQNVHSTRVAAEQGSHVGHISDVAVGIAYLSIIIFIYELLQNCINFFIEKKEDNIQKKAQKICSYFFLFALILEFCLLILYISVLSIMRKVDLEQMKYFSENNCSDEVLGFALDKFYDGFSKDYSVVVAGFVLLIITFLANILNTILLSDVFMCIKCRIFKDRINKDSRLELNSDMLKNKINSKIGSMFKRNKKQGDNNFEQSSNTNPEQIYIDAAQRKQNYPVQSEGIVLELEENTLHQDGLSESQKIIGYNQLIQNQSNTENFSHLHVNDQSNSVYSPDKLYYQDNQNYNQHNNNNNNNNQYLESRTPFEQNANQVSYQDDYKM
ncbi:UNKNOWN [Stylonychia lemnae]|uniref:Transmembrane protein n=1 Tax=Stylonychia lemnae TaxID=5949 RepID=A0A078AAG7_STYLE|nr:UNKNOWN [Stylonychia lemnae]|eukprot:CDW79265.1 UNKNOWN [Stylonychia lemnae]